MTDAPSSPTPNIARILSVVRRLVDFGRGLADTLRQRTTAPEGAHFTFGTTSLARVLDIISRALRRAAAFEAVLLARAQRGRDVRPLPFRGYSSRPPASAPRTPRTPRPDADPADEPSVEQIAAELRRRPIGAVIVDLCRDLGVMPGNIDPEFWHELRAILVDYNGSLIRLLRFDRHTRVFKAYIANPDLPWPPPEHILEQALARPTRTACPGLQAGATGPPFG